MPAPTLATETWAQIIPYIAQDVVEEAGSSEAVKAAQADLARLMRVSSTHYAMAAPLLYHRVQTHDLCRLLEGVNSFPIKQLPSKRDLCSLIDTIILLHPSNTQLESHITYAVKDELEKYRPNALKHTLTRSTDARAALRAALGQVDEEALVAEVAGDRVNPGVNPRSKSKATVAIARTMILEPKFSAASGDGGESCMSAHMFDTLITHPFTSLRYLSIGSPKARTMSRRPDSHHARVMDIIAPKHVCCWVHVDDDFFRNGDLGFLPAQAILAHHKRLETYGTYSTPVSGVGSLVVHIDPLLAHVPLRETDSSFIPRRPLPALVEGSTTWKTHASDSHSWKYYNRLGSLLIENLFHVIKHAKQNQAPYDLHIEYQMPILDDFIVHLAFRDNFYAMCADVQSSTMAIFGLADLRAELENDGEDTDEWTMSDLWDKLLPEVKLSFKLVKVLTKCSTCSYQGERAKYYCDNGHELEDDGDCD